jgi:hypothetical protein
VAHHLERDARRAFGPSAALLPTPHRGEAEAEAPGEPRLRHAELAPQRFDVELGRDANDELARAPPRRIARASRMLPRILSPAADMAHPYLTAVLNERDEPSLHGVPLDPAPTYPESGSQQPQGARP